VSVAAAPIDLQTAPRRTPWLVAAGAVGAAAIALLVINPFGSEHPPASPDASAAGTRPADGAEPPRPYPQVPDGMVLLGGGTFTMGSTAEQIAAAFEWCGEVLGNGCSRSLYEREQPTRKVTLRPFLLDANEVTNGQFAKWLNDEAVEVENDRYVQSGGVRLLDLDHGYSGIRQADGTFQVRPGFETKPVVQVTWFGALLYCRASGRRLPTEAEWELATRGAAGRAFPWGDERDPACSGVAYGRGKNAPCASQGDGPADVGTSKLDRTPEGINDLGGNVAEWTMDAFAARYDASCAAECDSPVVVASDSEPGERVVRGGYWGGLAESLRAAGRSRGPANEPRANLGFRCAAEVPDKGKTSP